MKIIADQNIYQVENAFSDLGTVTAVPSYKINRAILEDAQALLVRSVTPVNRDLLEGMPVKFVASATIGVDHIDLDYLHENCIGFAHAPGSNADSVAEYVIAAVFQIISKGVFNLKDLKLGIIGAGNVGSRIARLARALGMECLLNDPPKRTLTGNEIYLPLEEVLKQSDIVSLNIPLTMDGQYSTYHMVNADFVSLMKSGAALINTSRGKIIDEKSFRTVREHLGILVLDVFENEPSINMETLRMADIVTPHIAGYSLDGKLRGTEMIYQAMNSFFFKEGSWSAESTTLASQEELIDLRSSKNPLYDAVLRAYPIMNDDEQFRQIFSVHKDQQARYFEELRKNYPKRLEFTHYKIILNASQSVEASILRELRFQVALTDDNQFQPEM